MSLPKYHEVEAWMRYERRNLLRKTKLQAFLDWAVVHGAEIKIVDGEYQKARIKFPGERRPHIIYDKDSGEHYSLEERTVPVFLRFHREVYGGEA